MKSEMKMPPDRDQEEKLQFEKRDSRRLLAIIQKVVLNNT